MVARAQLRRYAKEAADNLRTVNAANLLVDRPNK
jgi:hypothetical protein